MNKKIIPVWILLILCCSPLWAQDEGTSKDNPEPNRWREKVFFGGGGGLQLSNIVTSVSLMPSVGYRITPRWQAGVMAIYQYTRWRDIQVNSHSYGASPFTRYFIFPQVYAGAEYEQINFDIVRYDRSRERQWVDRMLLGAGYFQGGNGRGGFHIGIFYDVLYTSRQYSPDYPYRSPFVYRVGFIF